MKQYILLILAAGLLAAPGVQAQQGAYRFQPDKKLKYMMELKAEILQDAMGQTMSSSQEATLGVTLSLKEQKPEGLMRIDCLVDNAILIVESQQGMQTLGSALNGKTFWFDMKPNGDVMGGDTTLRDLGKEGSGMLQQFMELLPNLEADKIKEGNTWTLARKDTSGSGDNIMMQNIERKYTVKGMKSVKNHTCFEITFEGTTETDGKGARGGQDLRISGESKDTGTILYDAAEGALIELNQEEKGERQIAVSGSQSMKVNITSNQTSKIEFIVD